MLMELGFKSNNSIHDAIAYAKRINASQMGARIEIELTTGKGVQQINDAPLTVPLWVNIVYSHTAACTDLNEYKKLFNAVIPILDRSIQVVYVENEEMISGYANLQSVYAGMVNFNYYYWVMQGTFVGTGAAPMTVSAPITWNYLNNVKGATAANDFLLRWGQDAYSPKLGQDEMKLMSLLGGVQYHMNNLYFGMHYNLEYTNIYCLSDIIDGLRYYLSKLIPYPVTLICSELSSKYVDTILLKQAMDIFKNKGVYHVVGCSMSTATSVIWNDDMINMFLYYYKK